MLKTPRESRLPRTPKVLLLVENMSVPADPRVWKETQTLAHQGYQISIISPKGETRDREAYSCIEDIHIYRYRLPTTTNGAHDYVREYFVAILMTFLLSLIVWLRHGFDVIHAANPPDIFFIIGQFYKLFGKKYIFDQHDLVPEMFRVKFEGRMQSLYKLLLLCERCSYHTANLVITTNASQRQLALERGHCPANKVFVVRNGPDIARFSSTLPEPHLKRGKRYLLAYIGVMGIQDGVDYALQALHMLVVKYGRHDVMLTLMGDGDQLPRLRRLAHELDLDEFVHFTGWIPMKEALRHLATADIGLSPDPSNELNDRSTMLKTMEYMAMGKPIVAFDLPETRFSAQDAALYAIPNLVEDFAAKIAFLLDNSALRSQMGIRGRKRVMETLCWDRTKQQLWHAYHTLFPAA